jgi:hypothetical protein
MEVSPLQWKLKPSTDAQGNLTIQILHEITGYGRKAETNDYTGTKILATPQQTIPPNLGGSTGKLRPTFVRPLVLSLSFFPSATP